MFVFVETVFGCARKNCPTKCGGSGNSRIEMPPAICENLIEELRKEAIEIHLYGRGDIAGYPFNELQTIQQCYITVTNDSYGEVGYLRSRGAIVFSRIENSDDIKIIPCSDGYFIVQTTDKEVKNLLSAVGNLRPFAIKSLDKHIGQQNFYGGDLRLSELPPPFDLPSRVLAYTIPSGDCRIPLIGYNELNGKIYFKPCVSVDESHPYEDFDKLEKHKPKCSICERFPRQKRIFYYE